MRVPILTLAGAVLLSTLVSAQSSYLERLSGDQFDVVPPSVRVTGVVGSLAVRDTRCRSRSDEPLRRRIVDVAAQEWGFFGFSVVDQTRVDEQDEQPARRGRRRWPRLSPSEYVRLADSIAGYWTVTPEGGWILENQNARWDGSASSARWRYPWSAAFVSWVMCESGLDEANQFRRAIAHHTYIDQAIRARDGGAPAAYTAHDIGDAPILPGDLLCSGRRPAYRSLSERRRQMGEGARTHCDVVVALDEARRRILTIGGNVRGTVSLKLMPAVRDPDIGLRPEGGSRPLFAHLRLRAEPTGPDALAMSPTLRAIVCAGGSTQSRLAATEIVSPAAGPHC
jgi:hypothetical protein